MSKVKSLADLKRVREEALKKQEAKNTASKIQIVIGMGTVGIVAGARETLKAILDFIETEKLEDIAVRQTTSAWIHGSRSCRSSSVMTLVFPTGKSPLKLPGKS